MSGAGAFIFWLSVVVLVIGLILSFVPTEQKSLVGATITRDYATRRVESYKPRYKIKKTYHDGIGRFLIIGGLIGSLIIGTPLYIIGRRIED